MTTREEWLALAARCEAVSFLALLPKHKASLSLTHNDHKDSYATVREYIDFLDVQDDEWADDTQREAAIALDELWVLQWYPHTPVGFCRIVSADLAALFAALSRAKAEAETQKETRPA